MEVIDGLTGGLREMLREDGSIGTPACGEIFERDDAIVVHALGPLFIAGFIDKITTPRLIPGHPP